MSKFIAATLFCAALALSACGNTDIERGVTGAAIGGLGAAALGGNAAAGAVAGGAAGVFCDDVNLC